MTQRLAKAPLMLLALGLWLLAAPAPWAQEDDLNTITQQTDELFRQGKFQEALPIAEKAVETARRLRGPEHPDTATCLNILAALYEAMGQYAKAEPLFQEALRILQKALGKDHPATAADLNDLAGLYADMGDYAKAEPLYQEALRIFQKALGPEHPATAHCLNDLALLYRAWGDYAKAEALYQAALRICRKVLGDEHPVTAHCLNNLAELYEAMAEYAKAEPLYQEALQILQKALGPEHPAVASCLNNLAVLYRTRGDYAKAEPLYREALRIVQKRLGKEHPDTAGCLDNLAGLYADMGQYAKAELFYREALRIRQEALGPEHPATANCVNNLALLYLARGDAVKAEPLLQETLRIFQKVLGKEHPDTATCLQNLAYCEFDLGRVDEAVTLARQASAAELIVLSKVLSFTSEQQRLAYLDIFHPYNLFPFLKGTESDLAAAILRYKGVVLDSIVEDRLLAAQVSPGTEDQQRVEQLNGDRCQLGRLYLQPVQKLPVETRQRIATLEEEVEKLEGQLAQRVAGLGKVRRALGISLEQVQSAVPDDGALIEYLRYPHYLGKAKWEERYGAMVLLSKGTPRWIPLGNAGEIEHLVLRYGLLVRGSPDEDQLAATLRALQEALWSPIGEALPDATKRLLISPDGQLNFVSFAILLTKNQQFLAQRYSIQYIASGRDLRRDPKPSAAKDVVLFANPEFELAPTARLAQADHRAAEAGAIRGSEKRDIEDWNFGGLPGTQQESDALIKAFAGWGWKAKDFTGQGATKAALLQVHSPYILHLATHGFFAREDPTITRNEPEASINARQGVTRSKFFKNPMHRSGLALAGAQTTLEAWKHDEVPPVEDDGILTAEEVGTLDLQGTWLVTLSACETGSGEARAGEGVLGLRRGFIQAGAQNLLMTLWPISDEVTVQIMRDFYDAAHKTGNAPEALAEVQRRWLDKLRAQEGLVQAVNLAGPFIMSSQGKP